MKNVCCVMLFFLGLTTVFAQEYKLGNVTVAELEQKAHAKDPSAPAAVLFSKCENYMSYTDGNGFELVTAVEMKIKIYNKEGYEFANKVLDLYNNDTEKERAEVSKAYTYNLVNGKVEKTKLKSDGEFVEVVNANWKRKKIMMPDVKEGSVVEYKYVITSPFKSVMPSWRFQEPIPVNYSSLTTRIPEYYEYNASFRGYFTPKITKVSKHGSVVISDKTRSGNRSVHTTFTNDKIDFSENGNTYELTDLPALKDESFVANINSYASGIEHELNIIRWPGEPVKSFSSTWEDVVKTIYNYDDFGGELKKTGYFEDDLKTLLASVTNPADKIAAIFNYVKTTMTWNENYGYSCNAGVRKAYKEKLGNVAEINLMLTAMLNYAGLDANPVLVTTRSQKIALFPSRNAFNYVICGVHQGDNIILLDATSKNSSPNVLPSRVLNWKGRLIEKGGASTEVDLMPTTLSKEVTNVSVKLDNTGKSAGKVRIQYTDNNALGFRDGVLKMSKESYIERMEKRNVGLEVSELKYQNDKEIGKPVMEEFDYVYNNASEQIGDKLYVSPMQFFGIKSNPFKNDKREYPIDFTYPQEDKYVISISLPEGYVVESLPQTYSMSMEENIGSFKYTVQQQGQSVQLMVIMDLNYPLIPSQYYDTLKSFFAKVVEKETEKIVLKKA